jgi:trimethylamine-N-oxide reductase (cytochrome c)
MLIAKKLGLDKKLYGGLDLNGLMKAGWETSGAQDRMSFNEFMDKGYYVIPTKEKWEDDPAGFYPFYIDPKNNPLLTPTGKLEYYSEGLAEYFPDDEERPLIPKWVEKGEYHPDERLTTPRAKKYPYLLVSNHPRWRVHVNLDDASWMREIPTCKVRGEDGYQYEPVWINPVDAEKYKIKSGDIVALFNDRGEVFGGAYVTERIMPGAVYQDHGARADYLEVGKVDRSGSNNLICPSNTTSKNAAGEVTSGYLVGLRKVDIKAEQAKYPDTFKTSFSKGSGPTRENYVR